jgi:hypothetical protein
VLPDTTENLIEMTAKPCRAKTTPQNQILPFQKKHRKTPYHHRCTFEGRVYPLDIKSVFFPGLFLFFENNVLTLSLICSFLCSCFNFSSSITLFVSAAAAEFRIPDSSSLIFLVGFDESSSAPFLRFLDFFSESFLSA